MGQFKIEIVAVGGHGCQRELKDGKEVWGCRSMGCPDCRTREFVYKVLKELANCNVESAKIVHWPGTPGEVTDDLMTKIRHGSF